MQKYLILCFLALCACFLGGCATAALPGAPSFTIISDQTDKIQKYYTEIGGEVREKDCLRNFLFLFWWGTNPVEETLLAKILDEHNADALVNAEFKHSWADAYIYTHRCLTITGTPVKLKEVK